MFFVGGEQLLSPLEQLQDFVLAIFLLKLLKSSNLINLCMEGSKLLKGNKLLVDLKIVTTLEQSLLRWSPQVQLFWVRLQIVVHRSYLAAVKFLNCQLSRSDGPKLRHRCVLEGAELSFPL